MLVSHGLIQLFYALDQLEPTFVFGINGLSEQPDTVYVRVDHDALPVRVFGHQCVVQGCALGFDRVVFGRHAEIAYDEVAHVREFELVLALGEQLRIGQFGIFELLLVVLLEV